MSVKLLSSAKPDGPVTLTRMVPLPAAVAATGTVTAPRSFARKVSFCVAAVPTRTRVRAGHGDRVVAGLPFDIVEIEMKAGAVARQQEARQRRREHDRIAHNDVGRARGRPCPCSTPPP